MKYTLFLIIICSSTVNALNLSASRTFLSRPVILIHDRHNLCPGDDTRKRMGQKIINAVANSKINWIVGAENYYASDGGDIIKSYNNKYLNLSQIMDDIDERINNDKNTFVSLESRNIITLIRLLISLNIRLQKADDKSAASIISYITQIADYIGDISLNDIYKYFLTEIDFSIARLDEEHESIKQILEKIKLKIVQKFSTIEKYLFDNGFQREDFFLPILGLIAQPHERTGILLNLFYSNELDCVVFSQVVDAKALESYARTPKDMGFLAVSGYKHTEWLENTISQIHMCSFEQLELKDDQSWEKLQHWIHNSE